MTAYPVRGRWSRRSKNQLPDSAFLFVERGSFRDAGGRTHPLTLRHLPYRSPSGAIDRTHLANSIARLSQAKTLPHVPASLKAKLLRHAKVLYEAHFGYRRGVKKPRPALKERAYPVSKLPRRTVTVAQLLGRKRRAG